MTDRDDLLRRVRVANPAAPGGELPAGLVDARPPLSWLIEGGKGMQATTTAAARPLWRPVLVVAAAVVVTLAVGLPLLLAAGGSGQGPAGSAPPATTLPGVTATTAAIGAGGGWQTVVFSEQQGLPPGGIVGVAVDRDGTAWAARVDADRVQLFRLDLRWRPVGEALPAAFLYWMIPDGAGGLLLSVPPRGWDPGAGGGLTVQRVVRFGGGAWSGLEEGQLLPDLEAATIETGPDGTDWIVGYTAGPEGATKAGTLLVARVADGALEIHTAGEMPAGWVVPDGRRIAESVAVAFDGAVWAAGDTGVCRFAGETFEFLPLPAAAPVCCVGGANPLAVDAAGRPWVLLGESGTALYRLDAGEWVLALELSDDTVLGGPILATPDGAVWVLARGDLSRGAPGNVYQYDGSEWAVYSRAEADALGLPIRTSSDFMSLRAPDGTVITFQLDAYLGPGGVHLFVDGGWDRLPTLGLGLSPGESFADRARGGLAVGPDGSVWLPAAGGVARLVPSPWLVP